ncbi:30S ribosomal protein S6 alpha, chloroplastic-like [Chenopodium quinoa]|nr:30S ribosomal protein S6 alpha, chloroplastic-like [Chenopodium quinoa]
MATFSLTSTLPSSSPTPLHSISKLKPLSSNINFTHAFNPNPKPTRQHQQPNYGPCVKALSLDFSGSFFEGGFGGLDEDPPSTPPSGLAVEDKPEPQCPPGLRKYETMAVLRPDMTEDERLTLTQKYEELLVAGGAMYVEVFNRGVIPLAYSIKKKNKAGETNTYLDGIYLLFTYFTKPESISALEATLQTDDDVIRSTSFKIRKRKY